MRDVRKEMESAEEATYSIWESQDAELTDQTNLVWDNIYTSNEHWDRTANSITSYNSECPVSVGLMW